MNLFNAIPAGEGFEILDTVCSLFMFNNVDFK